MFTAILYVCLVSIAGPDCNESTASMTLHAPPSHGFVECLRDGQALVAQSGMVTPGHYPKVRCQMPAEYARRNLGG